METSVGNPNQSLLPQPANPVPIEPMRGGNLAGVGGGSESISLLPQPSAPVPIEPMRGGGSDDTSLLPQPPAPVPIEPMKGGANEVLTYFQKPFQGSVKPTVGVDIDFASFESSIFQTYVRYRWNTYNVTKTGDLPERPDHTIEIKPDETKIILYHIKSLDEYLKVDRRIRLDIGRIDDVKVYYLIFVDLPDNKQLANKELTQIYGNFIISMISFLKQNKYDLKPEVFLLYKGSTNILQPLTGTKKYLEPKSITFTYKEPTDLEKTSALVFSHDIFQRIPPAIKGGKFLNITTEKRGALPLQVPKAKNGISEDDILKQGAAIANFYFDSVDVEWTKRCILFSFIAPGESDEVLDLDTSEGEGEAEPSSSSSESKEEPSSTVQQDQPAKTPPPPKPSFLVKRKQTLPVSVGGLDYEIRKATDEVLAEWANATFSTDEKRLLVAIGLDDAFEEAAKTDPEKKSILARRPEFLRTLVVTKCMNDSYYLLNPECNFLREFLEDLLILRQLDRIKAATSFLAEIEDFSIALEVEKEKKARKPGEAEGKEGEGEGEGEGKEGDAADAKAIAGIFDSVLSDLLPSLRKKLKVPFLDLFGKTSPIAQGVSGAAASESIPEVFAAFTQVKRRTKQAVPSDIFATLFAFPTSPPVATTTPPPAATTTPSPLAPIARGAGKKTPVKDWQDLKKNAKTKKLTHKDDADYQLFWRYLEKDVDPVPVEEADRDYYKDLEYILQSFEKDKSVIQRGSGPKTFVKSVEELKTVTSGKLKGSAYEIYWKYLSSKENPVKIAKEDIQYYDDLLQVLTQYTAKIPIDSIEMFSKEVIPTLVAKYNDKKDLIKSSEERIYGLFINGMPLDTDLAFLKDELNKYTFIDKRIPIQNEEQFIANVVPVLEKRKAKDKKIQSQRETELKDESNRTMLFMDFMQSTPFYELFEPDTLYIQNRFVYTGSLLSIQKEVFNPVTIVTDRDDFKAKLQGGGINVDEEVFEVLWKYLSSPDVIVSPKKEDAKQYNLIRRVLNTYWYKIKIDSYDNFKNYVVPVLRLTPLQFEKDTDEIEQGQLKDYIKDSLTKSDEVNKTRLKEYYNDFGTKRDYLKYPLKSFNHAFHDLFEYTGPKVPINIPIRKLVVPTRQSLRAGYQKGVKNKDDFLNALPKTINSKDPNVEKVWQFISSPEEVITLSEDEMKDYIFFKNILKKYFILKPINTLEDFNKILLERARSIPSRRQRSSIEKMINDYSRFIFDLFNQGIETPAQSIPVVQKAYPAESLLVDDFLLGYYPGNPTEISTGIKFLDQNINMFNFFGIKKEEWENYDQNSYEAFKKTIKKKLPKMHPDRIGTVEKYFKDFNYTTCQKIASEITSLEPTQFSLVLEETKRRLSKGIKMWPTEVTTDFDSLCKADVPDYRFNKLNFNIFSFLGFDIKSQTPTHQEFIDRIAKRRTLLEGKPARSIPIVDNVSCAEVLDQLNGITPEAYQKLFAYIKEKSVEISFDPEKPLTDEEFTKYCIRSI